MPVHKHIESLIDNSGEWPILVVPVEMSEHFLKSLSYFHKNPGLVHSVKMNQVSGNFLVMLNPLVADLKYYTWLSQSMNETYHKSNMSQTFKSNL